MEQSSKRPHPLARNHQWPRSTNALLALQKANGRHHHNRNAQTTQQEQGLQILQRHFLLIQASQTLFLLRRSREQKTQDGSWRASAAFASIGRIIQFPIHLLLGTRHANPRSRARNAHAQHLPLCIANRQARTRSAFASASSISTDHPVDLLLDSKLQPLCAICFPIA